MKKYLIGLSVLALATTTTGLALAASQEPVSESQSGYEEVVYDNFGDLKTDYFNWLNEERDFLKEINPDGGASDQFTSALDKIEAQIKALNEDNAETELEKINSALDNYYSSLNNAEFPGVDFMESPEEMQSFYLNLIAELETLNQELSAEDKIDTTGLDVELDAVKNLLSEIKADTAFEDPIFEKLDLALDNYYQKLDDVFKAAGYELQE